MAMHELDDAVPAVSATVVGSLNRDRVLRVASLPVEGETSSARSLAVLPGGKGANQAVALARLECRVRMAGSVGDDADGRVLLDALDAEGIDTSAVSVTASPTGTAVVLVDDAGDNLIVVHAGANGLAPEIPTQPVDLAVLQLELPVDVVEDAVRRLRPHARRIVLNAAPPATLDPAVLAMVDVIIANQHEAAVLTGSADPEVALPLLREMVGELAVVTLGGRGGLLLGETRESWDPVEVDVVDTTGAGDCFVAAFSVALARGATPGRAGRWAARAAALAVGRPGAQAGMPRADELDHDPSSPPNGACTRP